MEIISWFGLRQPQNVENGSVRVYAPGIGASNRPVRKVERCLLNFGGEVPWSMVTPGIATAWNCDDREFCD